MPIGQSFVGFIHKELEAESLPPDRLGALDCRSIALAKTESRAVLDYLKETARLCEDTVDDAGGLARCDGPDLNHELRTEFAAVPAAARVHRPDRTGWRIPESAAA